MITEEREELQSENERDPIASGAQELAALHGRIGPHFRRAEVRERVGHFLEGLLAPVERKNGWQLAEELGESGPKASAATVECSRLGRGGQEATSYELM